MATLMSGGKYLYAQDSDPAPGGYNPIPRYMCTTCGVRLFLDSLTIHQEYHEKRGDYDD